MLYIERPLCNLKNNIFKSIGHFTQWKSSIIVLRGFIFAPPNSPREGQHTSRGWDGLSRERREVKRRQLPPDKWGWGSDYHIAKMARVPWEVWGPES